MPEPHEDEKLDEVIIGDVKVPNLDFPVDIEVVAGRISAILPHATASSDAGLIGGGDLAVPAFVDGHVHLDKTLLGLEWIAHETGPDVKARVAVEKRLRREHLGSAAIRARTLLRRLIGNGSTAIRTHVDIDEESRLSSLEDILKLRVEYAGFVDMQIVAFPQSGLWAGPHIVDDLDAALKMGADAVGGVDPTIVDGDPGRSLDTVFALAEKHDAGVDIHLHEPGEMGAAVIAGMCDRTLRAGLAGRVVVSHAFCLATLDKSRVAEVADAMAMAGVAVMCSAPGHGSLIPVTDLAARGVMVFAGSDNIRDAWAPFGNGDMLDRARLLAYRGDLRHDRGLEFAFDCVSRRGTEALGFERRGLEVGDQADFVLLKSPSLQQAVCDVPATRRVIRKGQIIAQHYQPASELKFP